MDAHFLHSVLTATCVYSPFTEKTVVRKARGSNDLSNNVNLSHLQENNAKSLHGCSKCNKCLYSESLPVFNISIYMYTVY